MDGIVCSNSSIRNNLQLQLVQAEVSQINAVVTNVESIMKHSFFHDIGEFVDINFTFSLWRFDVNVNDIIIMNKNKKIVVLERSM
jgi:hypothetical protein